MFANANLSLATVIFINNFAFPVELNQKLGAHIEAECTPGTKVLTYKPITAMGRRTRGRQNNEAAQQRGGTEPLDRAGLHETGRGVFEHDGVSWTSGPIEYITYVLR